MLDVASGLKKICFLIIVIFILFLAIGCWDRREPEDLGIVLGVGFGSTDEGEKEIRAELANSLGLGGEEGIDVESDEFEKVIEASGDTFFEAERAITQKSPRELAWSHTSIIYLGQDMAEEGIHKVVDFLNRDPDIRLIAFPLVVDDLDSAMDINFVMEQTSAMGFVKHFERTGRLTAALEVKDLRELNIWLSRPGWELTLPRLHIETESENGENDENEISEDEIALKGLAVFKKDELVGELNERETRGYSWIIDEVDRTFVQVQGPEDIGGGILSIELFESTTKITPELEEEEITIELEVDAAGVIRETAMEKRWLASRSKFINILNARVAEQIENKIELALDKAQKELEADIFGFGFSIYTSEPEEWEKLEDEWREIYPEVEVEVEVEAQVTRTGIIKDTIKIE